jgi:hypothetical protein
VPDPSVVNLLLVTGAAGAFFLVLKWLADGRFHTDSEVVGLRQDKEALLAVNQSQADALKKSNELLAKALEHRRDA